MSLGQAQLAAFYSAREPSKLGNVPLLLEKFTPAQIAASVWRKFGALPEGWEQWEGGKGGREESRWKPRRQGTVDVGSGAGKLNGRQRRKQVPD